MNGVVSTSSLPAITVLRLTADRPLKAPARPGGTEVLLAAVTHPPRIGEARPIAALIPEVLARYGLADNDNCQTAVDLLA